MAFCITRILWLSTMCMALSTTSFATADPESGRASLELDDYFLLKRVQEMVISADGQWLAYIVSSIPNYRRDFSDGGESQRPAREVLLQQTSGAGSVLKPEALQGARGLAWVPNTGDLAFISDGVGGSQVAFYDPRTLTVRQRTYADDPVSSFRISPDGRRLAYLTRASAARGPTRYEQIHAGERGFLADTDTLSIYDFINQQYGDESPHHSILWVQTIGHKDARRVPVPGDATDGFYWAPNSSALSVGYVADGLAPFDLTSVGIYQATSAKFRVLAEALERGGEHAGIRYSGGEWIPGTHAMVLRRASDPDPWLGSFQDWAIVDVTTWTSPQQTAWRSMGESYGGVFTPLSASRVLVENTIEGVRTLYELTGEGFKQAKALEQVDGSSSLIRISADFATVAFVNESLTRPPEVYIRSKGGRIRQLTALNSEIADRVRYRGREVRWTSVDGARVHGWLLEPPAAIGDKPWPLVTHVHGGPGSAYTNAFASYFGAWPYPFELLAERGIAVFLPNYRGTLTYGEAFATPNRLDGEPLADVVMGIEHLIQSGVADPERLGITGHSHGAWLAPLMMVRERIFAAGSFSEGTQNKVLNYLMMPGDLNRRVHVPKTGYGSSLFDNWRPYVRASADLHMQGLRTATLWEGGARSLAVLMISGAKAARHAGAPTEFIIYPQTDHNPHLPSIQRESAERNLDWFAFWLQKEELQSSHKKDQYERWRRLREQQEAANVVPRAH